MANYKGMTIPTYKIPSDSKKTPFLRKITIDYGSEGFNVIVNLDRYILSGRYGYYVINSDDLLYDLRKITDVSSKATKEIVRFAIEKNYYNKAIFDEYNIITNLDLVKTFIKECKNRKGFKSELKKICTMFKVDEQSLLPKKREKYNTSNLTPLKQGEYYKQPTKSTTNNSGKIEVCSFVYKMYKYGTLPPHDTETIKRIDTICKKYINDLNFPLYSAHLVQRLEANKGKIHDYVKFIEDNLNELFS